MKPIRLAAILWLLAWPAFAADLEAGRARVATVCAACHGADGVSVSDRIPHLAGQRAGYLADQLEAFRDGSRKSDIMNVIAPQLSEADIANVAAYFSSLQGAASGAHSAQLPNLAKSHVTLPASFDRGYTRYLVKDNPEGKQVSIYYANQPAASAAAAGLPLPDGSAIYIAVYAAKLDAKQQPVTGTDGKFVPDRLLSTTAMASGEGWGRDIPEILRNGNWNYAVFAADGTLRTTVNQAECLACHKPKEGTSFLFLHAALAGAGGAAKR
jgi:cytochrome c553